MKVFENKKFSVFGFLWYFVSQRKIIFFIQSVLSLSWAIKETMVPVLIKNMVNIACDSSVAKNSLLPPMSYQIICFLMIWVFMEVSMRVQKILALKAFPKLKAEMRQFIFDYMIAHSYNYFNTAQIGTIVSKISELPRASESLIEMVLVDLIAIGSAITIGIVVLWGVDIRFAGLFFLWLLMHLGISIYYAEKCHNTYEKYTSSVMNINGRISDVFSNILSILLFSQIKHESNSLKTHQETKIDLHKKARESVEKLKAYQGVFTVFYLAAMLGFLVFGWLNGTVSIGDFSLIPMLSCGLLGMVWWFSNQIHTAFREIGNIKSGLMLFQTDHEVIDESIDVLNVTNGAIKFEDVSFKYPGGKKIFDKISLSIPARKKIGIAGLSGSGKSTFIYLILRLFDLETGSILIDDQNIAKVTQESLRSKITVIPQELALLNRTIFENILYGKQSASEEEVYRASELAGCHEFIEKLPLKYQTLVGEKGLKLSGGQRQRISIARAILKDAPILILDEAISALDSITEIKIQENLEKFMVNKTVIVISHRAIDFKNMDGLLIFKEGKIIETKDWLKFGLYELMPNEQGI